MDTRDKLTKRLNIQEKIEGKSDSLALVRRILQHTKTSREWDAATTIGWHKYGATPFDAHRFYYPAPWLAALLADKE